MEHHPYAPKHRRPPTPEENHLGRDDPLARETDRSLETLHDRYGLAFSVHFKRAHGVVPAEAMAEDFQDLYYASFENLRAFLDEAAAGLGLDQALTELSQKYGVPENIVGIDYDALCAFVDLRYDYEEAGGLVHVFYREP